MKSCDVVIVGAGIIGMSIAWQLARRSSLKITVLEKGRNVGEGSTGASSAVCRFRYSTEEMIRLARDGIRPYQHWEEFTGISNPRVEYFKEGVLWLPGPDQNWADIEHERLGGLGISTAVLRDEDLNERFPGLSTCTIAPDFETGEDHECRGGQKALFEVDGGYVSPVDAVQDLVDACRQKDLDIRIRSKVVGVRTNDQKVVGITLENGERIDAPVVLNAAGPWCNELNKLAGVDTGWNIVPTRIQVAYRDRPEELVGHIPAVADLVSGIYFRTEGRGRQLVLGSILEEDEKQQIETPDSFQKEIDDDFAVKKLHALHHRLPSLPYRGRIRGLSGLYSMNKDDVHPILGETNLEGYWVANGFSGHGFKLAPAVGAMIAKALTGDNAEFDTDVPIQTYSVDRSPISVDSMSVLA